MAKAKAPAKTDAERLLKQRQAVAKEFGIEDTADWRVRRLALLQAQHAAAEDMIADGRPVDINGLLSLDKAIEDLRASLKAEEPLDIKVHIVQGVTGIYKCTKCGHQNELKPGEYTPRKQPTPSVPLPPPPAAPTAAQPQAVYARPIDEAPKPAVEPDKPHVTHRKGVSASAFHSQVVNGVAAPLKKDQPSPYAIRKTSPMSR
jgi:hypothetical protein